jgi:hypothetical protein
MIIDLSDLAPMLTVASSIHDPDVMATSPEADQATSKLEESTSLAATVPLPNPQPQADLPPKPVSVLEENHKKGFFPISWRVIGGGVMMGGKSECFNSCL